MGPGFGSNMPLGGVMRFLFTLAVIGVIAILAVAGWSGWFLVSHLRWS